MLEFAAYLENVNKPNLFNKIEAVVEINKQTDGFFDKTLSEYLVALQQSHSPFLSKLMTEENLKLPEEKLSQITTISNELSFDKAVQNDIEKLFTKLYLNNSSKDISVSKSVENEFVVFISMNGTYKNILIDEDGDIELLIIPPDKSKTYNKRFYKEDGLNFSSIVSTFNEM